MYNQAKEYYKDFVEKNLGIEFKITAFKEFFDIIYTKTEIKNAVEVILEFKEDILGVMEIF